MADNIKQKIEGIINVLKEEQEKSDQKNMELIGKFKNLLSLMDKYKGRDKFTEREISQIQSITCYKNLGYCCSLSKECLFRDTALEIIGISRKQFKSKENWVKEICRNKLK